MFVSNIAIIFIYIKYYKVEYAGRFEFISETSQQTTKFITKGIHQMLIREFNFGPYWYIIYPNL